MTWSFEPDLTPPKGGSNDEGVPSLLFKYHFCAHFVLLHRAALAAATRRPRCCISPPRKVTWQWLGLNLQPLDLGPSALPLSYTEGVNVIIVEKILVNLEQWVIFLC